MKQHDRYINRSLTQYHSRTSYRWWLKFFTGLHAFNESKNRFQRHCVDAQQCYAISGQVAGYGTKQLGIDNHVQRFWSLKEDGFDMVEINFCQVFYRGFLYTMVPMLGFCRTTSIAWLSLLAARRSFLKNFSSYRVTRHMILRSCTVLTCGNLYLLCVRDRKSWLFLDIIWIIHLTELHCLLPHPW